MARQRRSRRWRHQSDESLHNQDRGMYFLCRTSVANLAEVRTKSCRLNDDGDRPACLDLTCGRSDANGAAVGAGEHGDAGSTGPTCAKLSPLLPRRLRERHAQWFRPQRLTTVHAWSDVDDGIGTRICAVTWDGSGRPNRGCVLRPQPPQFTPCRRSLTTTPPGSTVLRAFNTKHALRHPRRQSAATAD